MAYENCWYYHGLYRKFTGVLTGEDIAHSNLALHGDARFDDLRFIINDFLDVESAQFSEHDIDLIAHTDRIAQLDSRNVKIAIIANTPDLIEMAAKYMQEMEAAQFACKLFDDPTKARHWAEANS